MKRRLRITISGLLPLLLATAVSADPLRALQTEGHSACEASERWQFGASIPQGARQDFQDFLAGRKTAAMALSEALALKRGLPGNEEVRIFSEYWISRALKKAELHHAAYSSFAFIANYPPNPKIVGTQMAAMDCLSRTLEEFPSIDPPREVVDRLPAYFDQAGTRPALVRFAGHWLRYQISRNRPKAELQKTLTWLRSSPLESSLAQGLVAARTGESAVVIRELQSFLQQMATSPDVAKSPMKRYLNQVHLLLARALYTHRRYDQALAEFRRIEKSSNEFAQALSEQAWSGLMARRYSEAMGAAISLQSGGLRRTFAPEGPMVLAMAMNELCEYPDSLRAIQGFRRSYEKPYRWLSSWQQRNPNGGDIYPLAVAFLKKRSAEVPDRVASEWIRSPIFISGQEELNLLSREKELFHSQSASGSDQQKKMAQLLQARGTVLKMKVRAEKGRMKTYSKGTQGLSEELKTDLAAYWKDVARYQNFRLAGAAWQGVRSRFESLTPVRRTQVLARINRDLNLRSARMYFQLLDIAENNQLVEVEIYQGASQDIIWQNAHPEYKLLAKQLQQRSPDISGDKVWDWGRAQVGPDGLSEIWEDELGSFRADVVDHCSSKDKYLALKKLGKIPTTGSG